MFSTNPRIGVRSLLNMEMAFSATLKARSCGVDTTAVGAGKGDHLAEAQLDVPGTGRQIDEQVVELAPFNAAEEPLDHLGEHESPPDGRLSLWHEEADRHDLDSVAEDGNDLSIPRRGWSVGPHDGWNARPVDISVHQAHPRAQLRKRDRAHDSKQQSPSSRRAREEQPRRDP